MAVDAGKTAHAFTVNLPALMTLGAELLTGKKMVQTALVLLYLAMALCAFNLFHKNMLGVENGPVDSFSLALCMALFTSLLSYDDLAFMTFRNAVGTMQYKTDEELVLLRNGQVMAVMAIKTLCSLFDQLSYAGCIKWQPIQNLGLFCVKS